jgi:hypothetical protein
LFAQPPILPTAFLTADLRSALRLTIDLNDLAILFAALLIDYVLVDVIPLTPQQKQFISS